MKKQKKLLYELPEVLFYQFLNYLGIKDVKAFVLKYKNGRESKIACLYATLPRHGKYENPTLVLLDLRSRVNETQLIILTEPPVIIDGEVKNLCNYANISAKQNGSKDEVFDITLTANMSYLGSATIGDPFNRFSFLYMLELSQKADELFHSKQFEWVSQYKKELSENYVFLY
ncbi:MAG: hypothetical protein UR85_C0003G0074 [Candidatus Nomurabacteria bacterium GW2011_GWF2_35_66]|uniref:Uncharacterized protein n=1 Tax=Candidatus Nomurabacteria bacterium GW2011_GWE1_35_16 TaxID=1618761 RepID=A0A0G0DRW9_9BACT|nr:MAG: hypothetical protein UR55_C0005G0073 [Candidatus Nomurabacteria bacterium GW2011_GWF1_34_20]KKP63401.1 MAG: hypothetical protein UR57_C0005G0073 [Candidatus Nomurabacteria bacterium GW2011_GWE2_34_25]KKP65780.1 MAG: hypothetical protein UR64_C0018G0002 [Candidatus Nomurabacteria bacterium GW2011_GWE1_35_16]KKP83639.1 MAG: hypothetical protein UR85_C0003G0074 [Candidatus Nomurabacteria bacterium GW2011_GWF2_35_66]HAE36898.1 hypothetical protein [Candidatus Nomurabacteria bacterium]